MYVCTLHYIHTHTIVTKYLLQGSSTRARQHFMFTFRHEDRAVWMNSKQFKLLLPTYTYTCKYVYRHVYMYQRIYIYNILHVYMYIHIYRSTKSLHGHATYIYRERESLLVSTDSTKSGQTAPG